MYRGTGVPAIVWNGVVYYLPRPVKGGRKEKYTPVGKIYENIDSEKIPGESKWRFKAEYEFANVAQNTIDTLVAIYNRTAVVKWIPHKDLTAVKYDVLIKEMTPDSQDGIIHYDSVIIKVESVSPVKKIPTADNMYGCVLPTRISVKE